MRPLLVLTLAAACGGGGGGEGELLRALGDDVDVVVVASPRLIADTWVERNALRIVPELPACVRDRARAADAAALTWAQDHGAAGTWSLVLIGGGVTAAGCDELERAGALAWFGEDPRAGAHRFFAGAERKRRWRALGDAPVRAIGDFDVQAGITVHAAATLDPRDGVDARATLRFDEPAAAAGFEEQQARWRKGLDRKRLGGAWPAFDVSFDRAPGDPTTLRAELRVPGALGDEAMVFATTVLLDGDLAGLQTPRTPCPDVLDDTWVAEVRCIDGRFTVAATLRDRIVAEPDLLLRSARVVPSVKNGTPNGFKLYAIRPASLVAALGLMNGDRVHTVDGAAIESIEDVLALHGRLASATQLTVELDRRGKELSLHYEIR